MKTTKGNKKTAAVPPKSDPPTTHQQPAPINPQPQQNNLAIVGFILAFFVSIAGLIVSIFALKKAKQLNGHHRGLAIAGIVISSFSMLVTVLTIIFVLALIPDAQIANRDTARNSDIIQITSAINGYITNNNTLPARWSDISSSISNLSHYLTSNINGTRSETETGPTIAGDFSWEGLFGVSTDAQQVTVDVDSVIIIVEARCEAGGQVAPGGPRQMAIVYKLEEYDSVTCKNIWLEGAILKLWSNQYLQPRYFSFLAVLQSRLKQGFN